MIAEKAYLELYENAILGRFDFSLKYSGKFNDYNANVKKRGKKIEFNLSRKWQNINDDVKIGLLQHLLNKLFGTRIITQNMDLYDIFLKKVHISVPKVHDDPKLCTSFDRLNEKYFYGTLEKPNLKWGKDSTTKLGSYEYGTDTIRISRIFEDGDHDLLDYVMYHEMLHKKHKFHTRNGKSFHHTKEFKHDERLFCNQKEIEKKLQGLVRREKSSNRKKNFWK